MDVFCAGHCKCGADCDFDSDAGEHECECLQCALAKEKKCPECERLQRELDAIKATDWYRFEYSIDKALDGGDE